jgi:hypothetical protein
MTRIGMVLVVLATACLTLPAGEPFKPAAVKKLATEMVDATVRGDFAKVIDRTYPGLVQLLGGRNDAIAVIEKGMKQLKDKGIAIKEVKVGDPGEFISEGKDTYVVVPTVTEMSLPNGAIRMKSYLLGISPDAGKTWTFVDGAGMHRKEYRDKLFPKLPEKLKLPEKSDPEFIQKDK